MCDGGVDGGALLTLALLLIRILLLEALQLGIGGLVDGVLDGALMIIPRELIGGNHRDLDRLHLLQSSLHRGIDLALVLFLGDVASRGNGDLDRLHPLQRSLHRVFELVLVLFRRHEARLCGSQLRFKIQSMLLLERHRFSLEVSVAVEPLRLECVGHFALLVLQRGVQLVLLLLAEGIQLTLLLLEDLVELGLLLLQGIGNGLHDRPFLLSAVNRGLRRGRGRRGRNENGTRGTAELPLELTDATLRPSTLLSGGDGHGGREHGSGLAGRRQGNRKCLEAVTLGLEFLDLALVLLSGLTREFAAVEFVLRLQNVELAAVALLRGLEIGLAARMESLEFAVQLGVPGGVEVATLAAESLIVIRVHLCNELGMLALDDQQLVLHSPDLGPRLVAGFFVAEFGFQRGDQGALVEQGLLEGTAKAIDPLVESKEDEGDDHAETDGNQSPYEGLGNVSRGEGAEMESAGVPEMERGAETSTDCVETVTVGASCSLRTRLGDSKMSSYSVDCQYTSPGCAYSTVASTAGTTPGACAAEASCAAGGARVREVNAHAGSRARSNASMFAMPWGWVWWLRMQMQMQMQIQIRTR